MRTKWQWAAVCCLIIGLPVGLSMAAASGTEETGVGTPVQIVVTVESRNGKEIPTVQQKDVIVNEGHDRDKVVSWVPAKGANAGMDLYVLVDDSAYWGVATQLSELQAFIRNQAPTTYVALGYMRNGIVETVKPLTQDHAAVAEAVRLPLSRGGDTASPYFSLQDLIKTWKRNPDRPRREVVMITNGVDLYSPGSVDPYLDDTISQLQRAGILVYCIYAPNAGHFGHSFWRINWGKNDLSELGDETGADSYNLGITSATFFKPYFEDISKHLNNQYLLTFLAKPQAKAGYRPIRVTTELSGVDLVSADRVYVPASSPAP